MQVKQIAVGTSLGVYLESNSNTACFIATSLLIITLYSDEDGLFFRTDEDMCCVRLYDLMAGCA